MFQGGCGAIANLVHTLATARGNVSRPGRQDSAPTELDYPAGRRCSRQWRAEYGELEGATKLFSLAMGLSDWPCPHTAFRVAGSRPARAQPEGTEIKAKDHPLGMIGPTSSQSARVKEILSISSAGGRGLLPTVDLSASREQPFDATEGNSFFIHTDALAWSRKSRPTVWGSTRGGRPGSTAGPFPIPRR